MAQTRQGADAMERPHGTEVDLLVVGAGAAGLTAALVGALEGLRVLVVEKSPQVGGTSATSSGTVWVPNNHHMRAAGMDDAAPADDYLRAISGGRVPDAMWQAYAHSAPEMLEYLEGRTDLRFRPYPRQPDYRQELPGAAAGWRPLEPLPFDGRRLGPRFAQVRAPIPELMLFGGMMVTRGEAMRLLNSTRPTRPLRMLDGWWLGLRLVGRYAMDRLRHKRGTRLVIGNALVARLFHNLLGQGGTVWLDCALTGLLREGAGVTGARITHQGQEVTVRATRGVVLAGGGFPANAAMREQFMPSPAPPFTPAFEGCTGETLEIAQAAGAVLGPPGEDNGLWFPSSSSTRTDGSLAVWPHIILDRAKPGLIAVNSAGRRFLNEGPPYHHFVRGMYRAHRETPCIPAWLVCDRAFVWKYGLGLIRPRTPNLKPFAAKGYLHMADSLEALASTIGVDAAGLADSVRRNNEYAQTGKDLDFGKGDGIYEQAAGDPEHGPNPCLGPIGRAPFCAVPVYPSPCGTSLGLHTNPDAQVLDASGAPMAGLYSCGNDMHSPVGGEYFGAGAQLSQGMTFAYRAVLHAIRGESS